MDAQLDFSGLTDDQLIGLIRAALRECVDRGGAVQAAAQSAVLDEAERAKIVREAADREAAKLRAQERERVAREAAEAVRRQREAQESAAKRAEAERTAEERRRQEAEQAARKGAEAKQAAEKAVRAAEERDAARKDWLRRFAAVVGLHPSKFLISRAGTRHGWRVLVNFGDDKYSEKHLVDYYPNGNVIHTAQSLVSRKRELIALCAEFWALNPKVETVYLGSEYTWEDTDAA